MTQKPQNPRILLSLCGTLYMYSEETESGTQVSSIIQVPHCKLY
jgi:hypothetical protein